MIQMNMYNYVELYIVVQTNRDHIGKNFFGFDCLSTWCIFHEHTEDLNKSGHRDYCAEYRL